MPAAEIRERFERIVASGEGDAHALAAAARKGDVPAAIDLAALMTRAGFVEPAHILDLYDAAAAGWYGDSSQAVDLTPGSGTVNPALWPPFWEFLDDQSKMDAEAFTMRTARLGDHVDEGFAERAAHASLAYPGVPEAAAQGWPRKFNLEELAACPANSLGGEFHRLIVEKQFDLEVLDRDELGLADLRPPLDYLNARILQCHDLWHIVGGYDTTALHETAISGFQLSKFGHNYSAQYLAFVNARAAIRTPPAIPLLLEITLSGWRHGRETPQLLDVDWPEIWAQPTETIREKLGVTAYASPFPADLVEQMEAASAA